MKRAKQKKGTPAGNTSATSAAAPARKRSRTPSRSKKTRSNSSRSSSVGQQQKLPAETTAKSAAAKSNGQDPVSAKGNSSKVKEKEGTTEQLPVKDTVVKSVVSKSQKEPLDFTDYQSLDPPEDNEPFFTVVRGRGNKDAPSNANSRNGTLKRKGKNPQSLSYTTPSYYVSKQQKSPPEILSPTNQSSTFPGRTTNGPVKVVNNSTYTYGTSSNRKQPQQLSTPYHYSSHHQQVKKPPTRDSPTLPPPPPPPSVPASEPATKSGKCWAAVVTAAGTASPKDVKPPSTEDTVIANQPQTSAANVSSDEAGSCHEQGSYKESDSCCAGGASCDENTQDSCTEAAVASADEMPQKPECEVEAREPVEREEEESDEPAHSDEPVSDELGHSDEGGHSDGTAEKLACSKAGVPLPVDSFSYDNEEDDLNLKFNYDSILKFIKKEWEVVTMEISNGANDVQSKVVYYKA